ncbi:hypothetical protein D3C80_2147930 [compost metagenome]
MDVIANVLAIVRGRIDRGDAAHLSRHLLGLHESFLSSGLANGRGHAADLRHEAIHALKPALSH